MTTENLLALWNCIELRQFVVDTAKSLSPKRKVQKDLVGHAWYRLGEDDAQKTVEYYKRYAYLVMKKRLLLMYYGEIVTT